jgi:hypothetical protein
VGAVTEAVNDFSGTGEEMWLLSESGLADYGEKFLEIWE